MLQKQGFKLPIPQQEFSQKKLVCYNIMCQIPLTTTSLKRYNLV